MDSGPTVFILDDDESFAGALERLLHSEGFVTRVWTSVTRFLTEHDADIPGCLISDLVMPEMSGLELQTALLNGGCNRPIVFITGQGDVPTTVAGMRAGAVSFLSKPVRRAELLEMLHEALARDATCRATQREQRRILERLRALTSRETQVLDLVAKGLLNKQIAGRLGTTEKTIKKYRGRLMHKMQVKSVAQLVQMLVHVREPLSNVPRKPAPSATQTDPSRASG